MASGYASGGAGKYCCTACNVKFPFKSKLERHLQSDDHKMFTDSLQASAMLVDDYEDLLVDTHPQESLHDIFDRGASPEHSGHSTYDDVEMDEDQGTNSDLDVECLLHEVVSIDGDYQPFPSKIFSLLFALLHSPRPMGESNLKFVWFILAKCGIAVPSISKVKAFKLPGMTTPTRCLTSNGTPFYMNSISSILRRCVGNPSVSRILQRFPVAPCGPYREIFHASRWHNDTRFYSPMAYLCDGTHAFIHDCVRCKHPQFDIVTCIITKYFMMDGNHELYADMEVLLTLEQYRTAVPHTLAYYVPYGTLIMFDTMQVPIADVLSLCQTPLSLLKHDHSTQTLMRVDEQEFSQRLKPHPMKQKADGKPVVMVPLVLFSDDTSGNKSKKWHKFDSWSVILAGLPRHENSKIPNLHFICCSDVVSAMDMSGAISIELSKLENEGIEAFDAHLKEIVVVVSPLLCIVADNPRASEILNHLGGSARRYCRMCMVDREVSPTEIGEQRNVVTAKEQIDEIKSKTSEREKAELRTRYGIKEISNPLLSIPADVFRSTPVETLHTILLGPYKYLLKSTLPKLSPRQKEELLARIRAFSFSGFRVRLIGNVVRYHQSFVGRDYKAWAQMAPFVLFPYLAEEHRKLWLALSNVFKIAYSDYYDPSHFSEWSGVCKEFVEAVSQYQPDMLKKQKVHLLLHLVECMEQFGPTSAFNSERFETFNSFIRAHNIYGNKHAPSRDIAYKFAVIEQIRYICEEGNLPSGERCGADLKTLFSSPQLQHFLNCTPMREAHSEKAIYQPGAMRKERKGNVIRLCDIGLKLAENPQVIVGDLSKQRPSLTVHLDHLNSTDMVKQFCGVIGQNSELVHDGDFVELSSHHYEMKYGILLTCCKSLDGSRIAIVRGLESMVSPDGNPITNECGCPLLLLSHVIFTTRTSEILKAVSVVHECGETCRFVDKETPRNIERENISLSRLEYEHDFSSNFMYCLNIFCIGICIGT